MNVENDGTVTVVIAAYGRPAALNRTLSSVYRQTYPNWRAVVVGDACSPEFFESVDRGDERVSFWNLPVRCGHQYGPNSAGIALDGSEFLAFLNHDDLWLEDHLERGLRALREGGEDVYLGRAAFCHAQNQTPNASGRLRFSETNRLEFLWRCMTGPFFYFEPASAWILRSRLAKQTGWWNAPDQVPVTPVMDWLMRLARTGARFHVAEVVSVLKLNIHYGRAHPSVPTYLQDCSLGPVARWLSLPADRIRAEIAEDLEQAESLGLLIREGMTGPIPITPEERNRVLGFLLYLHTGVVSPALVGPTIGPYTPAMAFGALQWRTGERVTGFLPAAEVLAKWDRCPR